MDPLSGVASVIAVIQIAGTVIDLCYQYRKGVKDAPKTIIRLMSEVRGIRTVLEGLDAILAGEQSSGTTRLATLTEVLKGQGLLSQCYEELENLKKTLDQKHGLRAVGQVLKWPLTEKDVERTLQRLHRLTTLLGLALSGDHTKLLIAIQADTSSIKGIKDDTTELRQTLAKKIRTDIDEKILSWLGAPDLTTDHENNRKKRQPNTGLWFINGDEFAGWKTGKQRFVWLYGIPGCGKTVLSSSIIEQILLHDGPSNQAVVAYFYFTFSDPTKQTCNSVLRSLILQTSAGHPTFGDLLSKLHNDCQNGKRQPTINELTGLLKEMLESLPCTYLVLDALDECTDREELLCLLKNLSGCSQKNVCILVTSREEKDIKDALSEVATKSISIRGAGVDADISKYINERLFGDAKLARWKGDDLEEIKSTISQGAQGMFRWAACQLDAIRDCRNRVGLRKTLKALPKDLHETYTRILQNINQEDLGYAIKVLHFLAAAARPVLLPEIAEFIAVDLKNRRLDADAQFQNPEEIMTICSSLITSTASNWYSTAHVIHNACEDSTRLSARRYSFDALEDNTEKEVRLAHLSVKEWLMTSMHKDFIEANIGSVPIASDLVAQTCMAYLLHFDRPRDFSKTPLSHFPFLNYAVYHSLHHLETSLSENGTLAAKQMAVDLLRPDQVQFINVAFVFNSPFCVFSFQRVQWPKSPASPGDDSVARQVSSEDELQFGSPLYWAAHFGKSKVCEVLIAEGADVNALGGPDQTPLNAAIAEGHNEVVKLLIRSGAELEPRDSHWQSPLQCACRALNLEAVKLLLSSKVDVNAVGRNPTTGLAFAAKYEDEEAILRLLLEAGANVNQHGGSETSPLVLACRSWSWRRRSNEVALRLLLDHGADVHDGEDTNDTALAAAVESRNFPAIRVLVERGANFDAGLQAAAVFGKEKTVRLLLELGADINHRGGRYSTALCAAAYHGHEDMVRYLLSNGAEIDIQDKHGWTAIQIALVQGHKDVYKELSGLSHDSRDPTSPCGLPPDKIASVGFASGLTVHPDRLTVLAKNLQRGLRDHDHDQVRANHPASYRFDIFYYEVRIIDAGEERTVGFGLCEDSAPFDRMPGWNDGSWGYHGDDGKKFGENGRGKAYGPTYGDGDIVGCGFDYKTRSIFFTKNGVHLGIAFTGVSGTLFAVLGTGERDMEARFNFGAKPFAYRGLEEQNRLLAEDQYYVAERLQLEED